MLSDEDISYLTDLGVNMFKIGRDSPRRYSGLMNGFLATIKRINAAERGHGDRLAEHYYSESMV